jgi:hypothetical protein
VWLGLHAYITVLNRRRSLYYGVIRGLEKFQAVFEKVAKKRLSSVASFDAILSSCLVILDESQWL